MGFASAIEAAKPAAHTADSTPTWLQVAPEKLPRAQLCRFTMFWSLAKVTRKSVIALKT